jgi:hypothetical protein
MIFWEEHAADQDGGARPKPVNLMAAQARSFPISNSIMPSSMGFSAITR